MRPQTTSLILHGLTHAGRVRSNNEDAYALYPQTGLAVLADGMGGSLAGEVASDMAMRLAGDGLAGMLGQRPDSVPTELVESQLLEIEGLMRAATRNANTAIHERSRHDPNCQGMGTTMVMAVFRGSDLLIGHVGDSRAYRLRPRALRLPSGVHYRHEIQRLTRDHSVDQALSNIAPSSRDAPQASESPSGLRLTRAIGVEPDVVLELHRHRLQPQDLILLCSDGLTDMVEDARIEQITHEALGPSGTPDASGQLASLAQALLDEAMRAGGQDNITIVLGSDTSSPATGA